MHLNNRDAVRESNLNLKTLKIIKQDFINHLDYSFLNSTLEFDLSEFNANYVNSCRGTFSGCSKLHTVLMNNFNVKEHYDPNAGFRLKDMSYMFSNCSMLENLSINNLVTTNVTKMDYTFNNCELLTYINI